LYSINIDGSNIEAPGSKTIQHPPPPPPPDSRNIEGLGVDQQQEKVAALHPPNPELEKEDNEEEVAVRQHEEGETEKGAEEGTVL
jgi:hypothetical protein